MNRVCFTGHRPHRLNGFNKSDNEQLLKILEEVIVDVITTSDVDTFITGMALGVDMWAADIIINLKTIYPHIKLIAAIPCTNQTNRWSYSAKVEYSRILKKANRVHYVSSEKYTPTCMQKRNEWMVDNSDIIIGVFDGEQTGGTYKCLEYGDNKRQIIINPKLVKPLV